MWLKKPRDPVADAREDYLEGNIGRAEIALEDAGFDRSQIAEFIGKWFIEEAEKRVEERPVSGGSNDGENRPDNGNQPESPLKHLRDALFNYATGAYFKWQQGPYRPSQTFNLLQPQGDTFRRAADVALENDRADRAQKAYMSGGTVKADAILKRAGWTRRERRDTYSLWNNSIEEANSLAEQALRDNRPDDAAGKFSRLGYSGRQVKEALASLSRKIEQEKEEGTQRQLPEDGETAPKRRRLRGYVPVAALGIATIVAAGLITYQMTKLSRQAAQTTPAPAAQPAPIKPTFHKPISGAESPQAAAPQQTQKSAGQPGPQAARKQVLFYRDEYGAKRELHVPSIRWTIDGINSEPSDPNYMLSLNTFYDLNGNGYNDHFEPKLPLEIRGYGKQEAEQLTTKLRGCKDEHKLVYVQLEHGYLEVDGSKNFLRAVAQKDGTYIISCD